MAYDILVADWVAAQIARECAVERGTNEKQDWAWKQWKEYNQLIGMKGNLFRKNIHKRTQNTDTSSLVTLPENGYPNPSIDEER